MLHGATIIPAVSNEPLALTSAGAALERLRIGSERPGGVPAGTLVALPFLPAGRYRLWVDAASAGDPLDVRLLAGRLDPHFAGNPKGDAVQPVGQ